MKATIKFCYQLRKYVLCVPSTLTIDAQLSFSGVALFSTAARSENLYFKSGERSLVSSPLQAGVRSKRDFRPLPFSQEQKSKS